MPECHLCIVVRRQKAEIGDKGRDGVPAIEDFVSERPRFGDVRIFVEKTGRRCLGSCFPTAGIKARQSTPFLYAFGTDAYSTTLAVSISLSGIKSESYRMAISEVIRASILFSI
jgi:hypothetical protein